MTESNRSTFARRIRAARLRNKPCDVWDDVITGLALRVGTTGYRSFFLRRSVRGRKRYATIGNADEMTVPEARRKSRELIAAFIDTVKTNDGPRTPGRPMDAFAEEFLERYARHWKPKTWSPVPSAYASTFSPPSATSPWTPSPSNTSRTGSPPWPTGPAWPTAPCRSCPL